TSMRQGIARELEEWSTLAASPLPEYLQENATSFAHPPTPFLEVFPPSGATPGAFAEDLQFHDNRYAWIGSTLRRTAVRFGWGAVALAEIRDLNRHRTGTKWCPLVPAGFYSALEQLPPEADGKRLHELSAIGRRASARARELLQNGDP